MQAKMLAFRLALGLLAVVMTSSTIASNEISNYEEKLIHISVPVDISPRRKRMISLPPILWGKDVERIIGKEDLRFLESISNKFSRCINKKEILLALLKRKHAKEEQQRLANSTTITIYTPYKPKLIPLTTTPNPVSSTTTWNPVSSTTISIPNSLTTTPKPVSSTTTANPVSSTTTSKPYLSTTTSKPVSSTTTPNPVSSTTTSKPNSSATTSKPVSSTTTPNPISSTTTSKPNSSTTTPKPVLSTTTPNPVSSTTTSKPNSLIPPIRPVSPPADDDDSNGFALGILAATGVGLFYIGGSLWYFVTIILPPGLGLLVLPVTVISGGGGLGFNPDPKPNNNNNNDNNDNNDNNNNNDDDDDGKEDSKEDSKERKKKRADSCKIDIRRIRLYPLIVNPSDHTQFFYPQKGSIITLQPGEKVTFGCRNLVTYACKNRTIIESETTYQERNIDSIRCMMRIRQKVKPIVGHKFGHKSQYRKYQAGLSIGQTFIPTINIYYSLETLSTSFVRTTLSRALVGKQTDYPTRKLEQDHCCDDSNWSEDVYKLETQRQTFNDLLYCHADPSHVKSCTYVDYDAGLYLVPSQLAPKSHFVYTKAGGTSFYYLNSAPQWKSIKEGNWAKIEDHVMKMAVQFNKDLVVITGVYGQLRLTDIVDGRSRKRNIFMDYNPNTCGKRYPVPHYFWKLVYEPTSNNGIVFVTVNNPYIKKSSNYLICKNPGQSINGQSPAGWKPRKIKEGYSYMCTVQDFITATKIDLVDKLTITKLTS